MWCIRFMLCLQSNLIFYLIIFLWNSAYKVQHFTQYVWADASKVGCAVSTRTKNEDGKRWLYVYLCCNYDRGNIIGQSVYKAGAPASMCKTGKNPKYPGLCSIKEPNKHQNQQNNNANTNVRATRTRRNVAPPQRNNRRWGWFWFWFIKIKINLEILVKFTKIYSKTV